MNYIYFNPREWSLEQTQYNTQYQNNGFRQQGSGWQPNTERSFIDDFDGGLVESLMFGGWNDSYVRVVSGSHPLPPDTEHCFVFWLNGGENDKNSEICQLQITFFGNSSDSNTYKLNRNYIKPRLHKQGWELYAIPFVTPASEQETVDTRFSFVSGNAPMAVKPAKELSFYQDWEDEPDEFAQWRPQRHNLIFEDGWPSINMYGGDKYSTDILRTRRDGNAGKQQSDVSGHQQNPGQGRATAWPEAALLQEARERQEELGERVEELEERYNELRERCEELQSEHSFSEEMKSRLEDGIDDAAEGMHITAALSALNMQFQCADEMLANQYVPREALEGLLNGAQDQLDSVEEMLDNREEMLDDLEDILGDLEDELEEAEEDGFRNRD